MFSIDQALELKSQIELEAATKEAILSPESVATDYIIVNILKEMAESTKNLTAEIAVEKYKVAFIGTVGSGKTTTICYLLDLNFEREPDKNTAKKSRKVRKMINALTTANGGTTLCEVELRHGADTIIELVPYTIEETEQKLKSFAEYIISRVNSGDESEDENDKIKEALPTELQRAILNLIGLSDRNNQSNLVNTSATVEDEPFVLSGGATETEKSKKAPIDQAISLYKLNQESGGSDEDYVQNIIKLANLDERNVSSFSPKTDDSLMNWLFDTFTKINVGTYPNMVLPKRIVITLSFAPLLDKFESFIDTKGLDNGSPRTNISNLMEDINTLCVFTSKIDTAPEANISEFLKRAATFNSKRHYERHMMLVLPRKDEAEDTLGSDGIAVDDFDEGIKIKADTILSNFVQYGIKLTSEQISFYNPRRYFDDDFFPKPDYTEEIIEEKRMVFEAIENLGRRKKELTSDRLQQIHDAFNLIRTGNLLPEDEERLNRLKDQLRDHRLLNFFAENFKDKIVQIYRDSPNTRHFRIKHSLNSNNWIHPWREIDVVLNLRQLYARKIISDFTKTKINEIKAVIHKLASPDGSPLFKQVSKQLFEIFESRYTNFIIETEQNFSDLIKSNLTDAFIQSLYDEYGLGGGYQDRLCNLIAGWIDKNKLRNQFEVDVNNQWTATIDSYIKILK